MEIPSSKASLTASFPILFGGRWRARGLEKAIADIDPLVLCAEYAALRKGAPRRSRTGKPYFVGHGGVPSTSGATNRREEHCAIALYNLGRRWPRPDGGWVRLLDYQVPLKARRADAGVGKIDLLGVTDGGRLTIIELKVVGDNHRGDAPPTALMEGLRYAAMVEADIETVAAEAERRFGAKIARIAPIVQVLAPVKWWREWLDLAPAGAWGPAFAGLVRDVEARADVTVECLALDDVDIRLGANGVSPRLADVPALYPVRLGEATPIGEALSMAAPDGKAMPAYLNGLNRLLWAWADRHHADQLDGGRRQDRPPVLTRDFSDMNVLVPPGAPREHAIRAAIVPGQRHQYFGSLRSSQALVQSVFGAIAASSRLDLFEAITAECGRPAFFTDHRGWRLGLEHQVDTLGEPRPTSIDVLLSSPNRRVAVECKFTEGEFGACSRPRLRPGEASYPAQYCDGNYRIQAKRAVRCALTSIGVRYWDYLPRVFDWAADRDHAPCPFGAVYQLARNALAAVVTPAGSLDPGSGHMLVVYDVRNPAFQAGGTADRQWEAVVAACLFPGLLRRLSWQRLLGYIAEAKDLAWLVDSLEEKYGLVPD